MKTILAWLAVNALLVSAQVVGAATSWAFGTLLLFLSPELAREWLAWALVAGLAVGASIAFCFWVVRFAQHGVHHDTR